MNANDREELVKLNTEVSYIKKDINTIKANQENANEKVDKLLFHVVGESSTHTKGIVETSRGIEVRLSRLERVYLALGFTLGLVMMFRDKILSLFI